MSNPVFPNTFLIGVQKAGTTTLDDWLSQHPEIYCYESLKDIHLFARFSSIEEMNVRLKKEPIPYKGQPVVLQSAVNYIYYPSMPESIAAYVPNAKLIAVLRNPVDRAVSSYTYFQKMLRETRPMKEALLYTPTMETPAFTKDNSDFTYIEHGFYAHQIQQVLRHFKREQLLILDYAELAGNADALLHKIFSFLEISTAFKPDLSPKNVTGAVRNQYLQDKMINKGKLRKWIVDHIVDPIFPVGKRKMLKKKIFEFNTAKKKTPQPLLKEESKEAVQEIKQELSKYFEADVKELDQLLGTNYSKDWLAKYQSKMAAST